MNVLHGIVKATGAMAQLAAQVATLEPDLRFQFEQLVLEQQRREQQRLQDASERVKLEAELYQQHILKTQMLSLDELKHEVERNQKTMTAGKLLLSPRR